MNPFSFKEKGFSFVFFQIDINLDNLETVFLSESFIFARKMCKVTTWQQ